ncbi:PLC-like phosphodiesterase [Radiomyces spectabilis]|uniref:PLC-like phosphodiesterase n=1 Tax=Radiomyces spectabilis TaxID=64574 RepID=UPI00221FE793|nr:PLC-like phosphodiesterase [Radiomyces spectabilis]KAI8368117.1 PLC-like phosphodiesterase [Radiomyces spectabilis]
MTLDETAKATSRNIPDVIAHRGFSGKYPENTIQSYEKAVEAGTTALEGDIRISKDGEVIMMHDLSLQRTTTGTGAVNDCLWHGYIDGLVTKAGQQPIPRLQDVFNMLLRIPNKSVYMIIDIKFDNPLEILDAVHLLVHSYNQEDRAFLEKQVVFGVWHPDFLKRAKELFPEYALCFIGLSLEAARKHFLHEVDQLSMPFATLVDEDGQAFIKEAQALGKRVYCWTINDIGQMHNCVVWGVNGVVGDFIDTLVQHVRHDIENMTPDNFDHYLKSCTYLSHRRRRWYYYLLKKGMYWASWKFIGI